MKDSVHRVIAKCAPLHSHPEYFQWQKATIVLFIGTNDGNEVERKVLVELEKRNWVVERLCRHDVLIYERIKSDDAEVLDAYKSARNGGLVVKIFLDKLAICKKNNGGEAFSPSRITETTIDEIILKAGGKRIEELDVGDFSEKNADYILGNIVFELKDLQEEGLDVQSRQEKLGEIFTKYADQNKPTDITSLELTEEDFRSYCDLIGRPIQNCIKKASKQLKSTITNIKRNDLESGIILLNTGYLSIPNKLFTTMCNRHVQKDSKFIKHCVTITSDVDTDGWDYQFNFSFHPNESDNELIRSFCSAFWGVAIRKVTPSSMDFVDGSAAMPRRKPIVFSHNGCRFVVPVPEIGKEHKIKY